MQSVARHVFAAALVAFAAACLYGLRGDISQVSLAPLTHSWDLVVLAVLCSLLNYALRIIRWQRYLTRLQRPLPLGFTSLTYVAGFAFTVSPGKVGEMARARYYSRCGISVADVAGAFFIERLMDVIAMMVLATLIVSALPRFNFVIVSAGLVVAVALVTLALLPWRSVANTLQSRPRLPRVLTRLAVGAANALGAARSLLSPELLLAGFVSGLLAWGLEGIGLYALASIFPGPHMTATTAVGIYAAAVLLGALSFLPGGLGSTEAAMAALLAGQGYPVGNALVITIACRLVTLWFAVLIGWAAVFGLRNRLTPAVPSWR